MDRMLTSLLWLLQIPRQVAPQNVHFIRVPKNAAHDDEPFIAELLGPAFNPNRYRQGDCIPQGMPEAAQKRRWSLRVIHAQHFHPWVNALACAVQARYGSTGINLYWSPPRVQALKNHADVESSLIVQTTSTFRFSPLLPRNPWNHWALSKR